jgi:uncharacterized lipoprotein YbaY
VKVKNMKQSILVAALLAIALTGCAGKQGDAASAASEETVASEEAVASEAVASEAVASE